MRALHMNPGQTRDAMETGDVIARHGEIDVIGEGNEGSIDGNSGNAENKVSRV